NGVEALEAIDKFHPDLVITDVDMPHINGIQLIKQMSDRKYKCKSLLLTVYKDFQYIKTAMDYGTSGYLLKPVDEDELIESLIKVRKELDGNKLLSEAFDIVKEKFLCSLIEDSVDYEEIGTDKSNLGITFSENDAFAVMVVEIDNIFDINPGEIDIEGVSRAIISDIDYIVNMTFSSCTFRDNMDRICVLLWHADKSILESKTFNVAEEFRIFTGKKSGLILTVGMSSVLRGSENLKYLYDEAVRILESAFLLGKNKVIRHAEGFYPANMTDMR
ncbi:MAG TPA: hypothetical protein DIW17_19145, partial [Clostridiales bacterium]|nr:hypothetical protein [Clostridiales bacterium]